MLPCKQALPQQTFLHLLEGHKQVPCPLRGQADTVELILSVPGKDGDPSRGNDLHSVLGPEAQRCRIPPKHDAAQGAACILQGKIVVPRGVHFIV